jgi:integrase
MNNRIKLSVRFFQKNNRVSEDGKSPVYARVTYDKQRIEISTKRNIDCSKWSNSLQKVSGTNPVVKDIFLFCCYTGLCYVDVLKMSKDNICIGIDSNQWLVFSRTKTNVEVKMPLHRIPLELIEKYKNHPTVVVKNVLFPVLSNQKMNAYLKEIGDICGITKNLTMHIARHTFATTITLTNGMPIETVSKLLGHTKLSTTQHYSKVVDVKIVEEMDKIWARIG